jgi:hypothetical protein
MRERETPLQRVGSNSRPSARETTPWQEGAVQHRLRPQELELLPHRQESKLLGRSVDEGEAVELAAVRPEQNGLVVLDLAFALEPDQD